MSVFTDRMLRAARLDVSLYEEVEGDPSAMGQAVGAVVLSSVCAGIGSGRAGLGAIAVGALLALIGWYLWAYLTFLIGTKLLPEPQTSADVGEMLRTTGFSSSPGVIRVVGIIPGLSGVFFLIAAVWMLVAMVIAVRQALDYTNTLRAVFVCVIGWIIYAIATAVAFAVFGGAMMRPV